MQNRSHPVRSFAIFGGWNDLNLNSYFFKATFDCGPLLLCLDTIPLAQMVPHVRIFYVNDIEGGRAHQHGLWIWHAAQCSQNIARR